MLSLSCDRVFINTRRPSKFGLTALKVCAVVFLSPSKRARSSSSCSHTSVCVCVCRQ